MNPSSPAPTTRADAHAGDDWLDRMLEEAGREHREAYIADDGFTARIMARLPAPTTLPAWRRPAIILLWVLAAAVPILVLPGVFDNAFRSAVAMLVGSRIGLADAAMLMAAFGVVTWSSIVYALRVD